MPDGHEDRDAEPTPSEPTDPSLNPSPIPTGDVDAHMRLPSPVCEAVPFAAIALGCIAVLLLGIPGETSFSRSPEVVSAEDAPPPAVIEYAPAAMIVSQVILAVGTVILLAMALASRGLRRWLLPPPRNGPRTIWSLVELGQAAALAFVCFVLAAQVSFRIGADSPWRVVGYLLPQFALVASLSVLVFRQLCGGRGVRGVLEVMRAIGLTLRDAAPNSLRGVLGYLIIVPLAFAAAELAGIVSDALGIDVPTHPVLEELTTASGLSIAVLVLVAVVVAPFAEELFFRGFLYATVRDRWGPFAGMTVSALLFGIVHKGLPNQAVTFVMGLLLAAYYERAGSLLVPVLSHSLFNGVQIALLLAAT